jgi:regulator of sirC expression with transglutaminase-like and TPR domain
MRESEFNALIHLLEDDDPSVASHVEEALLSMGSTAVPKLEAAWSDMKDEVIQRRLEDIIRLIQGNETLEALASWRNDNAKDFLYGWYLITRYRFPNLDYTPIRNRINRLVNRTFLELKSGMDLPEKCMVINRMLFQTEGFRPDRRSPLRPENYYLNSFLDRKRGGPLSLGLLYIIIAEALEIPLKGILLPNHYFIVRGDVDKQPFFVDVFNRGAFFSRNDLSSFLKEHDIPEVPEVLQGTHPLHHAYTIVRILISSLARKGDEEGVAMYEKVIDMWREE